MDNPFYRRATEQLRDDEAFLSIVSPQPLTYLFKRPVEQGTLYDRLVIFRGAPGTGKTTIARLFDFSAMRAVIRSTGSAGHEAVAGAIEQAGGIKNGLPCILGCRLPMETDYRDFWEFPYADGLKAGLLFTFIQARAILSWFRHLQAASTNALDVRVIPRQDSGSAIDTIGGVEGSLVLEKARQIERSIYDIIGALVAPPEAELPANVTGAYKPFDVIEEFEITAPSLNEGKPFRLTPLVMLDDAHWLHPTQFEALRHWLTRRELRIARWVLTRFDLMQPSEALATIADDSDENPSYPGLSATRDTESILLQNWGPRKDQRSTFRRMARDMAERYLQKHSLLGPRRLTDIGSLLGQDEASITPYKLSELSKQVTSSQKRLQISPDRRKEFESLVASYKPGSTIGDDVRLAMLSIVMHRYSIRTKGQTTLFGDDPEPSRPLSVNPGVYEAARIHLLHRHDRPMYFGADALCDASSENAELFLQLCAILVDTVATQVIRSKPAILDSTTQNRLLRERAAYIINTWNFPYFQKVRLLVDSIARRCVETSLQPNGWLAPNSYGILQEEFDSLAESYPELALVLQFAVAYNAVLVVAKYECKGKQWCLFELGGLSCLSHGLTLKRGGFLEGSARGLLKMIEDVPQ